MLREAQWITKQTFKNLFFSAGLFIFLGGCVQKTLKPEDVIRTQTKQKVFLSSYDEVWRAAHAVLKYPIVNENQDTGLIETDFIKSQDGFTGPDQPSASSGLRYKIVMIFAKGKSQGQESVRLTIDKKIEKLRDFFSEAESLTSDGLEEKVLFYRIERELLISKGLKKAADDQAVNQ